MDGGGTMLVMKPVAYLRKSVVTSDRHVSWEVQEREIIALSESARTESTWMRTRVFDGVDRRLVAEMTLNSAVLKASYAAYDSEARALGRQP